MVTLLGPGGVGKTRLALEVAASVLDTYGDGVWFVDLASMTESSSVARTFANVLGISEKPNQPLEATLLSHVANRFLLIVLDNCEHLVESCARLASALLSAAPHVGILASSRTPMGVAGECRYSVSALSLRINKRRGRLRTMSDAAQLFVDRAKAARSDFPLTDSFCAAAQRICERLDGIPLAIELAAARTSAMSVREIEAKLRDRFGLLKQSNPAHAPRQQTLHALVNWSYQLLTAPEQLLFARLSVFAGGFDLAAAEQVCSETPLSNEEVLNLVTGLVDKSLVIADVDGGSTRYRLLQTIAEFAAQRLADFGETQVAARRHAEYYLGIAKAGQRQLVGPHIAAWIDRLSLEHDNLRAALRWCTYEAPSPLMALDLAAHLYQFWQYQRYITEGRERLHAVLARADACVPEQASALHAAGMLAAVQGSDAEAKRLLHRSLQICMARSDQAGVAAALLGLASVDADSGPQYAADALNGYRVLGDRTGEAQSLASLALLAMARNDWDGAAKQIEDAITHCRQASFLYLEVACELNYGFIELKRTRPREATAHFQRSQRLSTEGRLLPTLASAYRGLALAACDVADWAAARAAAKAAFATHRILPARLPGDLPRDLLGDLLYVCARLDLQAGNVERALRCMAACHVLAPWNDACGRYSAFRFEQERQAMFAQISLGKSDADWEASIESPLESKLRLAMQSLHSGRRDQLVDKMRAPAFSVKKRRYHAED
jgi:predicted ATPase